MLQQTQVGRVVPRWEHFTQRWPSAESFARANLADVLRAWQGLGYPRRAVALHRAAAVIAQSGWPVDEAGLRALPGVGEYTARALLVLALRRRAPLPRDVNISRVVARAALGSEPAGALRADIDAALDAGRPRSLDRRHYTYALFDVGAVHCRARPRCEGCPLVASCRSRRGGGSAPAARRTQPRYQGSMRQLRGRVLAGVLEGVTDATRLERWVADCPAAARPGAIEAALDGLRRDGLIPAATARAGQPPSPGSS